MITYDIRDYISILTIQNAFNGTDFCLKEDYLNKPTPLFPEDEYLYILPLIKKGLIIYRNAFGFDMFAPLSRESFKETCFRIITPLPEVSFNKEEIMRHKQEIDAIECCNYMNLCLGQLRNTDNFSLSLKTRNSIREALNVLTVTQLIHIIQAVLRSSLHLVKTGYFSKKIAAGQYIHLFQTRLRQVLEGKQQAIEEKETPYNYIQSQYSQIFFLNFCSELEES